MNRIWPSSMNSRKAPNAQSRSASAAPSAAWGRTGEMQHHAWTPDFLRKVWRTVVFVHWLGLAAIGLMTCVFLNFFAYEFLCHSWQFLTRTLFNGNW